jgi:esterase/lipase superfamily enzyme
MTIYFATNRNPSPQRASQPTKFGNQFNQSSAASLRFGSAEVKGKRVDIQTFPEMLAINQVNSQIDIQHSILGSKKVFYDVRERLLSESEDTAQDIVIYIHGFNNSFYESIYAANKLQQKLKSAGKNVSMGLFSWPSKASTLGYAEDRVVAKYSGIALARSVYKLANFLKDPFTYTGKDQSTFVKQNSKICNSKIHLVSHSMGCYLLRNALSDLRRIYIDLNYKIFDQVCLFAADEDSDTFEKDYKLGHLPRYCNGINVYFNRKDPILEISDHFKSNPERLGENGPNNPYNISAKTKLIDCTNVVSERDPHAYHINNKRVIEDLAQVLNCSPHKKIHGRKTLQLQNSFLLE